MKTLILLTALFTACGYEKEKDKDGVAPRLVSLNVEHDPDGRTQRYDLIVEGRTSTETVDQFIAYEISLAISSEEEDRPADCATGERVFTFYQQERIKVDPETKYYIEACSINKENGAISEGIFKVVETDEMPEDPYADIEDESIDESQIPFCEKEPNHVLCTESTDLCVRQPDLCLVTP